MSHGIEPGVKTRGSVNVQYDERVALNKRLKEYVHHKLMYFVHTRERIF